MSGSILLACANENHFANALPVAGALARRGWRATFLGLDAFYGQGVALAAAAARLPEGASFASLGAPALDPPFARRSLAARALAVARALPALGDASRGHAGVVVGMDGAPERALLARFRRDRRFTAILWDGLVARPPRGASEHGARAWGARRVAAFHARRALLRLARPLGADPFVPGLAGHTPVDRLYTMGPFVTRAFAEQGVRSPAEATGLPRLAPLFAARPTPAPAGRVLYLTGSFAWHDEAHLAECQRRELVALAALFAGTPWTLRVRVHPREDPAGYRALAGVELSLARETPLACDVAASEFVVTAMSTAALEAVALGRPVAVHLGAFPAALADLSLGSHPAIPVSRSGPALLATLERLRREPPDLRAILADFCACATPRAADAIADSITSALAARPTRA
jgi:hypothetical protein